MSGRETPGIRQDGVVAVRQCDLVVVCRKCRKRSGRKALRSELKAALKARAVGRRSKVVEAGCLGLCPKRAVALAAFGGDGLGAILILRNGAPAEAVIEAMEAHARSEEAEHRGELPDRARSARAGPSPSPSPGA